MSSTRKPFYRGAVRPKINILSSFNHPHVIPEVFLLWSTKENIVKNVEYFKQQLRKKYFMLTSQACSLPHCLKLQTNPLDNFFGVWLIETLITSVILYSECWTVCVDIQHVNMQFSFGIQAKLVGCGMRWLCWFD